MSVPTTAEVDELASLLGEEIPTEEQELDWQSDLFGTEASVPYGTIGGECTNYC